MKKLFLILIFLFSLLLVGCDSDVTITNNYVKDYISSYDDYDLVYVKDAICGEKHLLNEVDSKNFKTGLKYVYDSKAKEEPKNDNISKEFNKKSNFTSLTSPTPLPAEGVFNVILENGETGEFIKFIYINNEEEYSLRISDSAKDTACMVLSNSVKNSFGNNVLNYLESYCYNNLKLTDLYPIFNEINSTNISVIEIVTECMGVAPMSLKEHAYFEEDSIDSFIDVYKTATACKVDYYDVMVPGGSYSQMMIYMKDGQCHKFNFYQGCLEKDNDYYSLGMSEIYLEPNRYDYSFNVDKITGELYKDTYKIDDYTLDLSKIKFVPNAAELVFVGYYQLISNFGSIEFMDNRYFKYDNRVYLITEGFAEVDKLLNHQEIMNVQYIESPHVVTIEMLEKLEFTGLDTGVNKTKVESLNNYKSKNGESLASILGLNNTLTDEEIRNDYMFLIIQRNAPIHDDFRNVKYFDLFVESKNLYISIEYPCQKEGVYDAAVTTYTDVLLVSTSFGVALKQNFEVTFNSWYQDGKNIMLLCSDIYDIKEVYKKSSYYPNVGEYEITILKAYGRINEATALLIANDGIDDLEVETIEVVAGYEFIYPTSNTILVYYYNNIYTLTEAYDKNILKDKDIALIYQNYIK